jgi:hypothetical protein
VTSHRLTAEELDAAACQWAEERALAHGLPRKMEDPVALDQIATVFRSTSPARHLPAAGGRAANPTFPPGSPPRGTSPSALTGEQGEARPHPRPAA